jgi:hypothetical protein
MKNLSVLKIPQACYLTNILPMLVASIDAAPVVVKSEAFNRWIGKDLLQTQLGKTANFRHVDLLGRQDRGGADQACDQEQGDPLSHHRRSFLSVFLINSQVAL